MGGAQTAPRLHRIGTGPTPEEREANQALEREMEQSRNRWNGQQQGARSGSIDTAPRGPSLASVMKDQPRPGQGYHGRTQSIDRSGSQNGPPPLPQKDLPSIPQIEVFKRKGSLNRRQGSIDSTVSFGSSNGGGGGLRGVDFDRNGALPNPPPRLSTVMAEAEEMLRDDSQDSFRSAEEGGAGGPVRRWI